MLPVASLDTPIGRLWTVATERGLLAVVSGSDAMALPADLDPERSRAAACILRRWFDGAETALDVDLDLRASSPFDRAVYAAARSIPYGETASYAELGMLAGHPGAARAVGSALARCRVSPVVPCHRIISASGQIGGWGSDLGTKRWLLDHERRHSVRVIRD